ncbi:MAG: hypothetical protein HYX61_11380 [Gammaproteobacteria bacterium]|jgi:hypothetical protein|nr:hypothetical protein [Gammaproteobacteria bacterium]
MTIGFIVDQDIDVSNPQNYTPKQLEKCINKDNKSFVVFANLEDAIRVAKEDPKPTLAFPIFEVTYKGKGRQTDFELSDGEVIAARRVLTHQITLQTVSLAHAIEGFEPVVIEDIEDDEEELSSEHQKSEKISTANPASQTASRTQRLITGTGNVLSTIASYLPRPSILVGSATGAGTYYFDGANQVAPALMDSFRQSLPTGIPSLAVDATVAIGTGLVVAGVTEAVQRAPKPSLHFNFGRKNTATINSSATPTNEADTKPKCPVRF